jgi:RNA polymerase sigma-70 factor, ECF subfamily
VFIVDLLIRLRRNDAAGTATVTRGRCHDRTAAHVVLRKGGHVPDDATRVFEDHRELLSAVAYRVVGTVTDAEDVVQDAWLRWKDVEHATVDDVRGFLVTVTTRLAIDRLRRSRARRESYVGPWLPEPLLTGPDVADTAALADSVSMAMLVVLETLSPLERAVFILHEAFGYGYPEIARILGRSAPAVRQLGHRAHSHVRARRPRFEPDPRVRRAVTERFLTACLDGDIATLMEVLAPDVTLWADGGGRAPGPRRAIHGAARVARFFAATSDRIPPGTTVRLVEANGGPAALMQLDRVPYAVFVLDLIPDDHRVGSIRVVANPAKLTGVGSAPD